MNQDKERVQLLIRDTVSLLCKSTFSGSFEVRIQGLIGITIDDSDVLLVHFDESYSANEVTKPLNNDVTLMSEFSTRKRPRPSETTASASTQSTSADEPASQADCDVVFIADELMDSNINVESDQLYMSVDNDDNYDKSENRESVDTIDLNVYDVNRQHKNDGVINQSRARNALLRNMLPNDINYPPVLDQGTDWQMTAQVTSMKRDPTTTGPHVKQEYWNQPARQIVRRYRRHHQQALTLNSDVSGDNLVLTRSLHECLCSDCGKQFRHNRNLLHHRQQKHGCTPSFLDVHEHLNVNIQNSRKDLYEHENLCPDCGKQFLYSRNLLRHQTLKHGRTPSRLAPNENVNVDSYGKDLCKNENLCRECGKRFLHNRNLLRHQTLKHGRTPTRILGLQSLDDTKRCD